MTNPDNEALYPETLRDLLAPFIGRTLVGISQHDRDDYRRDRDAFVALHFTGGITLTVHIEQERGLEIVDIGSNREARWRIAP